MKYPRSRELVETVMRARGIEPSEEGAVPALSRQTGLDMRYLYRWYNGQARPNADNTIDLLQRAGVLNWNAVEDGIDQESQDASARRFDELKDELSEVRAALQELSAEIRDLRG